MLQTTYASERTDYSDPQTGARVIRWTKGPSKNQHLYFTTFSVTADDRWLVFLSDRNGHPNLYAIDRRSGAIRLLSRNESGLLRSYVYPQGGLVGLSKSSPCLDPNANRLYYIRDDAIFAVNLDDAPIAEQRIGEIPAHWYSAYTHVSPDGLTLCVPCTDPRAFSDAAATQWDQLRQVPARMKQEGLTTRILCIDTRTGVTRTVAEVPFWVTHVQFDPAGTGRIVFNQEGFLPGTGQQIPNRIWCLETSGEYRPLSLEPANEWRSHENWSPDGQSIVYHGARAQRPFIAQRSWDGQLLREYSMEGIVCYHATGTLDGKRLLADKHDGFIAIVTPGEKENRVHNLCRHDTSMKDQDTHAHPITTPSGGSLIFTSDRDGCCNVYEVVLPSQ